MAPGIGRARATARSSIWVRIRLFHLGWQGVRSPRAVGMDRAPPTRTSPDPCGPVLGGTRWNAQLPRGRTREEGQLATEASHPWGSAPKGASGAPARRFPAPENHEVSAGTSRSVRAGRVGSGPSQPWSSWSRPPPPASGHSRARAGSHSSPRFSRRSSPILRRSSLSAFRTSTGGRVLLWHWSPRTPGRSGWKTAVAASRARLCATTSSQWTRPASRPTISFAPSSMTWFSSSTSAHPSCSPTRRASARRCSMNPRGAPASSTSASGLDPPPLDLSLPEGPTGSTNHRPPPIIC